MLVARLKRLSYAICRLFSRTYVLNCAPAKMKTILIIHAVFPYSSFSKRMIIEPLNKINACFFHFIKLFTREIAKWRQITTYKEEHRVCYVDTSQHVQVSFLWLFSLMSLDVCLWALNVLIRDGTEGKIDSKPKSLLDHVTIIHTEITQC